MSVHEGHRQRMKKRFLEHGLDNFDDHNVFELLLFYALPRKDTNAIAHALMKRFGSLDAVFEAPVSELEKVEGVGENAALLLKLIPEACRRYMKSKNQSDPVISSSARAGEYMIPMFMYEKEEVLYLLCLDSMCRVICCRELARGEVDSVEVSVRKIAGIAINCGAASVIISHNHTNGVALPSREDELTTSRLHSALSLLGVKLTDHIIVAGSDYVSLADSGIIGRQTAHPMAGR